MNSWRSINRIYGAVTDDLSQAATYALEEMVTEVLDKAANMWEGNNWSAFNPDEVNCTVQLYRWMQKVLEHPDFSLLSVRLEAVQVTPEILRGEANAKSMRRPDLEVRLGRSFILVECKRLSEKDGQPRKYVHEGMQRFLAGRYSATPFGVMVGYVQGGDPDRIHIAINEVVLRHPLMGYSHELVKLPALPSISWFYESLHVAGPMRAKLNHFHLDLRATGTTA